jgi:hypothetical protein
MFNARARRAALAAGAVVAAFAVACSGGNGDGGAGGPAATSVALVQATPSVAAPAVYLSIGDSIQYGCCHDPKQSSGELFRAYLEQRLNRPVEWVTVAGNDTADTFLHGFGGHEPQIDRAVEALSRFRREGRPVVAITMSIGGNDYVEVGERCAADASLCPQVFADILARMRPQLPQIYTAIDAAKDPATPLFLVTYYNASDCGQPGVEQSPTDVGQRVWNGTIAAAAAPFGFFVVDLYAPFKGKACEYIENVDPTYAGYAVIAQQYEEAYDELPISYFARFEAR